MDLEGFTDDPLDCHPGIERGVRVLKNHLDLPRKDAGGDLVEVLSLKIHLPCSWLDQPDKELSEGAFSTPCFPNNPERFPLMKRKVEIG